MDAATGELAWSELSVGRVVVVESPSGGCACLATLTAVEPERLFFAQQATIPGWGEGCGGLVHRAHGYQFFDPTVGKWRLNQELGA